MSSKPIVYPYAARLAVFSHPCSPSTGSLPPSLPLQQEVPEACSVLVALEKVDLALQLARKCTLGRHLTASLWRVR